MSISEPNSSFAVPTLKVMRLQKPELDTPTAGTLDDNHSFLGTALCLPNSFGVIHVGETFTAYLGAINTSSNAYVTRLTVTAQLQTPSQRWQLASRLDQGNASGGVEVPPEGGIDAIVSHALEEAGQHILRVEVGYGMMDQNGSLTTKSLRKFYRFQVSQPLQISEKTHRVSDTSCFVAVSLEHNRADNTKQGLTISSAEFEPTPGLVARQIVPQNKQHPNAKNAVHLYDTCGRLEPGESRNYLFQVTAASSAEGLGSTKGIAAGDVLGKVVFTWRKACGEMGRIACTSSICPALGPKNILNSNDSQSDFVAHTQGGSYLSVDVAAMAASRAAHASPSKHALNRNSNNSNALDVILPVTVEPLHPPKTNLQLGIPFAVKFLIVNHSDTYRTLQLQFDNMKQLVVCGPSAVTLEELAGQGGSTAVELRFVALSAGLLSLQGCAVVDLATGQSILQPTLFQTFVKAAE